MIDFFYKNYPNKLIVTFISINTTLLIAKLIIKPIKFTYLKQKQGY